MNSTAIKEAVAVGYPRDKMYGVWWSGAEPDVRPAEDGAKGYNAVTLQHTVGPVQAARGPQEARLRQEPGLGQVGGDRRDPLRARPDQRHARRRGDPHRAGEVRQQADDRRAGALGPREPQPHRRPHQGARLRGRAAADQGVLRRPRGRAHRPHPDLGRQELEDHVGLVHQRRQRDRARWSRRRRRSTRPRRRSRRAAWRPTDAGPGRPIATRRRRRQRRLRPRCDARSRRPRLRRRSSRSTTSRWSTTTSSWCSRACRSRCRKGQIVALLGANGAGKSTTLKAISNLLSRRARRGHQGLDRVRGRRGARAHAQRAGAARLHPGDGRPPLLRPPHRRGEPAHRRLHAARRQRGDQARPRAGLFLFPAPQGAPRRRPPATSRAASSRCARSAAR